MDRTQALLFKQRPTLAGTQTITPSNTCPFKWVSYTSKFYWYLFLFSFVSFCVRFCFFLIVFCLFMNFNVLCFPKGKPQSLYVNETRPSIKRPPLSSQAEWPIFSSEGGGRGRCRGRTPLHWQTKESLNKWEKPKATETAGGQKLTQCHSLVNQTLGPTRATRRAAGRGASARKRSSW